MQTIVSENYYPLEYRTEPQHETNPTKGKHVSVRINRGSVTDSTFDENFNKLKYDSKVKISGSAKKNSGDSIDNIDGAVVGIENKSIFCELFTSPKHRFVHLPVSLFPIDNVTIGLPINISIDKSSGFRSPVVLIRKLEKKSIAEDLQEFDKFSFE